MPYNAVVFDLDGTLVESKINYEKMGEEIKLLLDRMGMKEHIEDRRKAYMVTHGGAETLLKYGLPPENLESTLTELNQLMNSIELEALSTMTLKPNAEATVKQLNNSGYRLGIATRSHGLYAHKSLDMFKLKRYFHGILGRDEVPYPKPDPRHLLDTIKLVGSTPEETLYIGDTTTDLTTAKAADVKFIGYWRDEQWAQRLLDSGCKKIIKDLWEIIALVKNE
ncbi:MAG: HAD family hydrolase [Candidatus Bathyarchaeota archaeon]|nr:HAD family hydrolase [Candidatus Bathyarchaeota archaeon]